MSISRFLCSPLILLLLLLWSAGEVSAANEQRIEQIKLERQKLAKVRHQLEGQMGALGRELRTLDSALIAARKQSRAATARVKQTDERIAELQRERRTLKARITELKSLMLEESVSAWKRGSRASQWLGIFTGVPVSDIPHRRYLLNRVVQSQQSDREVYLRSIEQLALVEAELAEKRKGLVALQQQKLDAERALAARVDDKRTMLKRVRSQVASGNRRDAELKREEKALLRLLDDMSEGLLAIEKSAAGDVNIRKRKGRLRWPLPGRIVASFGSRPQPSMPTLQGVQLRPKSGMHEVKAMAAGQVRYADWFGGFGLMTIVDYGNGLLGVYAHNDSLYKQLGDWVEEGEVIAEAGSTGWINSVALYFEIRDRGKAVNPKRWCRR